MSKHNPVAKAINYLFEKEGRWDAFTRFLEDGRGSLSDEQCGRAGSARDRSGKKGMAIRRLPARRRACRFHVQPHRHRQDERCRSAGLARRRAVPTLLITRFTGSTNSCLGIGAPPSGTLIKPPEPDSPARASVLCLLFILKSDDSNPTMRLFARPKNAPQREALYCLGASDAKGNANLSIDIKVIAGGTHNDLAALFFEGAWLPLAQRCFSRPPIPVSYQGRTNLSQWEYSRSSCRHFEGIQNA